jgi:hypothetical protein
MDGGGRDFQASPYTKVLRFPGTAYYCPASPGRGGSAES